MTEPVLIAGGGIGGFALGLSLHQVGIECRVFEAVETLAPLGVGINVLPHAVRELDELGLLDELGRTAVFTSELAYHSKRGGLIWSEPRGLAAGYRWPQLSIHRGELQMALYRACVERLGPDRVRCGHRLTHFEQDDASVTAHFTDAAGVEAREPVVGSVLIAADGIHSAIRKQLFPEEGAPVWKGAILWRGVSEARPFLTCSTMIMAGHEFQKFVCYPIGRTEDPERPALLNWIAERKFEPDHVWRREDWNRTGNLDDFLPQFEDWDFDWLSVPDLVRAARSVFEYPMVDRDPLPRWTHGRVTLLGDAAHPMYPIGSNGASQAIIDARVLTRELVNAGPTPAALDAYEHERREATSAIVLANRQNGPEQVMQAVEERAPNGFTDIEEVLSRQELEDTAAKYKQLAGFDRDTLNTRPSIVDSRRPAR